MEIQDNNVPAPSVTRTAEASLSTPTVEDSMENFEEGGTQYRIGFLYDSYAQYAAFTTNFDSHFSIESFSGADLLLQALWGGYPADALVASTENGGWELLETLRSDPKLANIPLILLTGKLSSALIQRARALRADDIFDGNFTQGDLLQRLRFLFKKKWYETTKAARRVQPL